MWFTNKKMPSDQIGSRLFEFKGAVQTCDLEKIRFSLKVLTSDFHDTAIKSEFYKEIIEFEDSLTTSGSRRKILYYSFENLLNSLKFKKDFHFNPFNKMPHGFSCPINADFNTQDFESYWSNSSLLKFHLDQPEIDRRVKLFSEFILDDNYSDDLLNDIKWHNSDLTSDIVSGSKFAGDTSKLEKWEEFSDSIMCLGKLSVEQKQKAIIKFKEMLEGLPYNNFISN